MDQICTLPVKSSANTCFGDEGNPLFIRDCNTQQVLCLIGVGNDLHWEATALRSNCSRGSHFTSVPYVLSWIRQQIYS